MEEGRFQPYLFDPSGIEPELMAFDRIDMDQSRHRPRA